MAQFDGGKYKDGILSYNYLGGEGGEGKGGVFIKQFKGKWHFVDEDGKVRTDVGIKGKLTPTHIQNLKDDNIFASAKVSAETGKEVKAPETKIVSEPRDNVGIRPDGTLSDGSASVQPSLAESNYELPEMSAPVSKAQKAFTPGDPAAGSSSPITASTENAPPTLQSGWGGETARYNKKMIGSGYSENTPYIPDTVSLPNSQSSPYGGSEFEAKHGTGSAPWNNSGQDTFASQKSLPRGTGGFESVNGVQELAGQNEFTGFGQDRMSGPSYGVTPSYQRSFSSDPALNTGTLDIGTGGEGSRWDSSFYRTKDGTLMKDTPWYEGGKDIEATQADIDAGIKDQNASPWGSAAGWQAAGSVMKGVGGLASAYTGFKNYELARDAHDTQKAQWQANYTQRLKAYEDNKALANQEIKERNRVLRSRNSSRPATDYYQDI